MADVQQNAYAAKARFKDLLGRGLSKEQAMAQVNREFQPKAAPVRPAQNGPTSATVGAAHGIEGALAGFGSEIMGALNSVYPVPGTDQGSAVENYRTMRDADQSKLDELQKHDPAAATAGRVIGGAATTGLMAPANTVAGMTAAGGAYGGLAGAGESRADLTKGEVGQLAKDVGEGAELGMVTAAGGAVLGKALAGMASPLKELGQNRLFKATVGQNKRAFVQVNGKGLWDKAVDYLDNLGIGFGDSTVSIGEKLAARAERIDKARAGLVDAMDAATPPSVSPMEVALRIEKEVGEPLKKLAANKAEYKQVQDAITDIMEIGTPLSFKDAAAQRAAYQKRANYDRQGRLPASEEINRKIAQAWNEVIDEAAEPVLPKIGANVGEYRELRREYALVSELLGHNQSRVAGDQANRILSPSDHGLGIGTMIATSNPVAGVAAATANHLGRNYGNAAAGRAAINVAKMAASSPRGFAALAPAMARRAMEQEQRKAEEKRGNPTGAQRER